MLPQNGKHAQTPEQDIDRCSIHKYKRPYEQFIWGLAFSNSLNTWKHADLTYLKAFISLHTLQVCRNLEVVTPQDQRPCPRPWDQLDGEQTVWAFNSHSLFYSYKEFASSFMGCSNFFTSKRKPTTRNQSVQSWKTNLKLKQVQKAEIYS